MTYKTKVDAVHINGLTQRQENFCINYVQSGDAIKAYRASYKAGGKIQSIVRECNKMLHMDKIKARIAEIRAELQERCEIQTADIMRELWKNAQESRQEKQYAASNQALTAIGNHLGMFEKGRDTSQASPLESLPAEHRQALARLVEAERERRRAAAVVRPVDVDGSGTPGTLQ